MRESAALRIRVPRVCRFIFWDRLLRPWRLKAYWPLTLPLAVMRNRRLVLDLVFILGICLFLIRLPPTGEVTGGGVSLAGERLGMPAPNRSFLEAGL